MLRSLQAQGPTILVSNAMWLRWGEVAVENEDASFRARSPIRTSPGEELIAEQKAAMIAMTAATHALDAFCGRFVELMPPKLQDNWRKGHGKRALQAWDTLRYVSTTREPKWKTEMLWLFSETRNPALHYIEAVQEPTPHPYYQTNVNPDVALYCADNATRAVGFMIDVMDKALAKPQPTAEAKAVAMHRHVVRLLEQRSSLHESRLRHGYG